MQQELTLLRTVLEQNHDWIYFTCLSNNVSRCFADIQRLTWRCLDNHGLDYSDPDQPDLVKTSLNQTSLSQTSLT